MNTASQRNRARELAIGAGLAVLTVLAYARVAHNGFINLDDNQYVTDNLRVQAGLTWRGIVWAFTTPHSANWHPLTWISHMLDCQLFGLAPAGHHVVNLAIHVASTLLLFYLFLCTTQDRWPSAFVAAAFALHPLHVESVAWIAERKDVLGALFWILTMLAYVRWVAEPKGTRYLAVLALFALGLLAKPMLVTLPFALILFDVWPLGRSRWWRRSNEFAASRAASSPFDQRALTALAREKIPLFALAAASSVTTFLVQRAAGAMSLGDQVSLGLRAQNALAAYGAYLWKTLWPAKLAVYYPYPSAPPVAGAAAGALALVVLTVLALRHPRQRPWLAVGWLWFVGTLVPVIGLVQVGSQAMADRYTYIPMIGLSAAISYEMASLARGSGVARAVLETTFTLALVAWPALTWRQAGYWKNDVTLFGHVVDVMPENHLAHGILGNVHLHGGDLQAAMAEYDMALRLRPGYAQGHSNVGMALELSGRPLEAVRAYETALRWAPNLPEAHHNLGRLLASQGKTQEAIVHLEAALAAQPDLVEAHNNLAAIQLGLGRIDEAVAHLRTALELKPDFPEAQRNLQRALAAGTGAAPKEPAPPRR